MKKLLSLVLIFSMMLIALSSCGKKKEEVKEETTTKIETTAAETETTAKKVELSRTLNPDIRVEAKETDKKTSYSVVEFGNYDMEVGYSGPIEWLIVDRTENSYLLVSRYILDCKNYNDSDKEVIWENSTLNNWLNNYFLNVAFSTDEKAYLNSVKEFGLSGNSFVTLLNVSSCEKYFGLEDVEKNNYKLSAKATNWAISNGEEVVKESNTDYYLCGSFHLTDNGTTDRKAAWVGQFGRLRREGQSVKLNDGDGVRPVIVVKKELFETEQDIVRVEETVVRNEEGEKVVETVTTIVSSGTVYSNAPRENYKSPSVQLSEANVVDTRYWEYGMTPITWVYVAPNTQIICNTSPNNSKNFAYKRGASSGSKGCYMTIFSRGEAFGSDFDGRLYSFEDYSKIQPETALFENKFSDLRYGDYSVMDLLSKKYKIEEVTDSVVTANGTYVNVVYVSELDQIIESMNE